MRAQCVAEPFARRCRRRVIRARQADETENRRHHRQHDERVAPVELCSHPTDERRTRLPCRLQRAERPENSAETFTRGRRREGCEQQRRRERVSASLHHSRREQNLERRRQRADDGRECVHAVGDPDRAQASPPGAERARHEHRQRERQQIRRQRRRRGPGGDTERVTHLGKHRRDQCAAERAEKASRVQRSDAKTFGSRSVLGSSTRHRPKLPGPRRRR
ncbi:hypothetical protein RhoFasB10_03661 [Rhodococcus sp. B10]|nr:hypothetical protein [Rhodococcus sp. B10]